jgi:hypothetical protein
MKARFIGKYLFLVSFPLFWNGNLLAKNVYDGFETQKLSPIWSTKRLVLNSMKLQHEIVRKGKTALEITIHPMDRFAPATEEGNASERDEISEADNLLSVENHTYSYQFSIFLPKTFPIVTTRLVLAQWKQECPVEPCSPNNPVVALRYVNGDLYITAQSDEKKKTIFSSREEFRGKWLDFRFEIRFSRDDTGFVKVNLDKKEVANFKGPTAFPEKGNYPKPSLFYFKMGLYRDLMKEPMSVFIDEYKKTEIGK